ncbi:hypothetical protein AMES_2886 [Amycolatopsis mediterranei S699]|uniref:DUF3806 domain-containing protein n=2 Tax=Amycolatopsis mediterranei TaxID=33910 RepID=A0A0H3D3C0_AMYMU|nr:hypothetical protein [Amycolatopsis mediterranei]ADJ44711.1 hypothetical protein AMED_2917 [Amycolatopsis mediterranei U32]AEK41454.1 hypothetical protein RAM_14830 [Amycolatopsis mediterranei S699]AFO76422.1 hypothetical protein AMES_2886 [Amycolatopsis mediterranei S699]AGT83551.1 hypothetical protein B737_2887 [Amycolatopsis mediterranei RB]KDO07466.1 hypothetical protein DV26_29710 [Amycolatopsis mediterranei]
MTTDPAIGLRNVATGCVGLVATRFGRQLDWSLNSLGELDAVCAELLSEGSLDGQRFDLWWKLIGAYTGEVLVRAYGGEWTTHEETPGAYVVMVSGATAFPFGIAERVLSGEPFKSLASFGRVFPAIVERAERRD